MLVNGYNHRIEKLLNNKIIPNTINDLCFKFYHTGFIKDEWDVNIVKYTKQIFYH